MVTEHFTVVAGIDDIRIVKHPALFKRAQHFTDLVINEFRGCAVLLSRQGNLLRTDINNASFYPFRFPVHIINDSGRHLGIPILIAIFSRWIEGVMRSDETDKHVPRKVIRDRFNKFGCASADVGIGEILSGEDGIVRTVFNPAAATAFPIVFVECLKHAFLFKIVGIGTDRCW